MQRTLQVGNWVLGVPVDRAHATLRMIGGGDLSPVPLQQATMCPGLKQPPPSAGSGDPRSPTTSRTAGPEFDQSPKEIPLSLKKGRSRTNKVGLKTKHPGKGPPGSKQGETHHPRKTVQGRTICPRKTVQERPTPEEVPSSDGRCSIPKQA